jgi:2-dehydro-3-deoxygalactonokinase
MAAGTEWIAVDWGTSNVRAWGIAADGSQTFSASSDKGMGRIGRADYPAVLEALIGEQASSTVDIVICGMAGARQGWMEAPYFETPAELGRLAARAVRPEGVDARFRPRILPGVCQRTSGGEDVMRGEETQVLGLLRLRPGFEGAAILPGTHSKWIEIRDGRIVRFQSAMTGELYEVLSQHSVLRHSFAGEQAGPETDSGATAGMEAGLGHPELVTSLAFRTRAASLLSGKGADWCSGYLSGLLIGTEIGGHRDWLGSGVMPLIGSSGLCRTYASALRKLGIESVTIDATDATLAGLKEARAQ